MKPCNPLRRWLFLLAAVTLALPAVAQKNVYKFAVKDGTGKEVRLKRYKGKVLLVVNTAIHCGFTPQYADLQRLYEKYGSQGLEILDFPCNQFGYQAPGSYAAIHARCVSVYGITFPQFQKIDVNGKHALPLYTYMKAQEPFKGFDTKTRVGKYLDDTFRAANPRYDQSADVKWNFTKFLVDREGHVVDRFEPTVPIDSVEAGVRAALAMGGEE